MLDDGVKDTKKGMWVLAGGVKEQKERLCVCSGQTQRKETARTGRSEGKGGGGEGESEAPGVYRSRILQALGRGCLEGRRGSRWVGVEVTGCQHTNTHHLHLPDPPRQVCGMLEQVWVACGNT
ncbi:hypothetical protein E2C01_021835 [Portunus trituberculatus]|uniref:Uncharacterized protein n=1 Tax=Portunus trituberculatus TaxID=210409 RepID=A0A5B7E5M9_PORTR|nr:hypothetical protein [Portunus trituberculatus]